MVCALDIRSLVLAYDRAREDERICREFKFPVPLSVLSRRDAAEEQLGRHLLPVGGSPNADRVVARKRLRAL